MGHATKGSTRGGHVRLSPRTIVTAALAIVDRDGADALTMRNLGLELCVDPTAVYRHFRDKEELLVAVANEVLAGVMAELVPSQDWRETIRRLAVGARRAYLTHPRFAPLLAISPEVLEGHEAAAEVMLGALRSSGLLEKEAALAYHALVNYVVGVSSLDAGLINRTPDYEAWRRSYVLLPEDRFPNCVRVAPHLYPSEDTQFEFGLNLLLDGIEATGRPTRSS